MSTTPPEAKRINKYLADLGYCSRREADDLIAKGWVIVNGEVMKTPGYKVLPKDKVELKPAAQRHLKNKMTIIINKPVGYVSAQAEEDYKPAIRLTTPKNYAGTHRPPKIEHAGFAPAGRLDIDSTGLLILTQDGKLAKQIISPMSTVEKEYLVDVEGEITKDVLKKLRFGLSLDGRKLKRATVDQLSKRRLRFVLKEGRKRQIRRMCEAVDLKVKRLQRVRVGKLKLGKLPLGHWRLLKSTEKI